ncbi:hypothetical protein ABMB67_002925 [Halalkalibacter oceani]
MAGFCRLEGYFFLKNRRKMQLLDFHFQRIYHKIEESRSSIC